MTPIHNKEIGRVVIEANFFKLVYIQHLQKAYSYCHTGWKTECDPPIQEKHKDVHCHLSSITMAILIQYIKKKPMNQKE
jgi:hypothetical protein